MPSQSEPTPRSTVASQNHSAPAVPLGNSSRRNDTVTLNPNQVLQKRRNDRGLDNAALLASPALKAHGLESFSPAHLTNILGNKPVKRMYLKIVGVMFGIKNYERLTDPNLRYDELTLEPDSYFLESTWPTPPAAGRETDLSPTPKPAPVTAGKGMMLPTRQDMETIGSPLSDVGTWYLHYYTRDSNGEIMLQTNVTISIRPDGSYEGIYPDNNETKKELRLKYSGALYFEGKNRVLLMADQMNMRCPDERSAFRFEMEKVPGGRQSYFLGSWHGIDRRDQTTCGPALLTATKLESAQEARRHMGRTDDAWVSDATVSFRSGLKMVAETWEDLNVAQLAKRVRNDDVVEIMTTAFATNDPLLAFIEELTELLKQKERQAWKVDVNILITKLDAFALFKARVRDYTATEKLFDLWEKSAEALLNLVPEPPPKSGKKKKAEKTGSLKINIVDHDHWPAGQFLKIDTRELYVSILTPQMAAAGSMVFSPAVPGSKSWTLFADGFRKIWDATHGDPRLTRERIKEETTRARNALRNREKAGH